MTALTIGWEYLTGYAVATDPGDRERVEWPPHPARAFMALAAAWFETGEDSEEGDALRWLEGLEGDPELHLPPDDTVFERSRVTVYVPVNDKAGPAAATLQCAPAFTRSKQARRFPRMWVGSTPCYLHWPSAAGAEQHRDALGRLCTKVTRIGHSSSLVEMWVGDGDEPARGASEGWLPDNVLARIQVRQTSPGMLDMLTVRYGEAPRQRHAELTDRIASLQAEKKATKGKGANERKAAIDESIDDLTAEQAVVIARPPVRPSVGLWCGYRQASVEPSVCHTHFDSDLVVLKRVDGPLLPVVSTLGITRALRDMVMIHSGVQPVPPWVSGHEADGTPLRDEDGHLAMIPLPFVGHEHADAHLLGMGLVFPRNIDYSERGRVLGNVLLDDKEQSKQIALTLGRLGVWTVEKRNWSDRQRMLQPEAWTAHPKGAKTWASVTPVVLDRFPKEDRTKNRAGWSAEVAEIIRRACERIVLPA
ncbi:MAG: type I-U CRISPR-associated protein Cas5/Cas6, partial [Planctomycetes bacterium]|nr:type I-U CRISPR-associated protein Cas5/Cas6 [Planctomycetota bacterium]